MSEQARGRGLGASPRLRQAPQAPPRAVSYAGGERLLQQAREVDYAQLHPDPEQPRHSMDPERIEALADSILAHGLLQPLVVRAMEEWGEQGDVQYRIVAGGRRYVAIGRALARCGDAALRARLSRVPVVLVASAEADIRVVQLIENLQREDLPPVDQARAFKELMDLRGLTATDLARLLHISDQTVMDRVRLLTDPIIADAVQTGQLSIKAAGLAQKLVPEGISQVHSRLQAGEVLDVPAITQVRTALERQGVVNPKRGRPGQARPGASPMGQAAPPGAPPGGDTSILSNDPNGLGVSTASNDLAVQPPRQAIPESVTGVVSAELLPDLEAAARLLARVDEATFTALLQVLDGAAARRLRYDEVRRLLLLHRRSAQG
jgi:ParB/RepB/Spo0J family partition protein